MRTNYWPGMAPALTLSLAMVMPAAAGAQAGRAAPPADLTPPLASIEAAIDSARKSLHIPGAALVIVKDDQVIYVKGLGQRDVEHDLPVTPTTQFAIGSATKAFTAMTAMMTVDDGKMNLADSPKKYVPYFKLRDPEADARITISDLLCHRSGLDRTDIAWYSNRLSSEETIRLVGSIKPTAKFGQTFQYQNVMFLVAGQCVAAAQRTPWRQVVAKRIFKPLHMSHTNTSIDDMVRYPDHSLGYTYDTEKKVAVVLPYRNLPAIAPAGAINSNAAEMAQWLRFMLGGGVFEGKRLVSEASFAELTRKRMTVGGGVDYGYGWFLRDWNGHRVVEHGGNIDGFNAQVAMMPDQHLGFVLLTNVSASPLGTVAMETVWKNLVGGPRVPDVAGAEGGARVAPELEAGTYRLAEANMDLVILAKDGKLTLHSSSITEKSLDHVAGRRYKLAVPGVDVFVTFRPSKDNPAATEILFEQPGARFVCQRAAVTPAAAAYVAPMSAEELLRKVVEAQGGEENLRRHKSLTVKSREVAETQGLTMETVTYARAPGAETTIQTMYAGRKRIATNKVVFDGKTGITESTLSGNSVLSGEALNDVAVSAALFPELNWKSLFKAAVITGQEKVGEEDAYVVELKPEKGHAVTDYVSTKSFRVLARKTAPGPARQTFSDFRVVDGVLIPFVRSGVVPGIGETVSTVKEVKFDAKLPDSLFRAARPVDAATNS